MAISAKDVKALREMTGAGMMDCKKVLTEADGDTERAVELLRERGLAKAGKRAGRETSEGTVAIATEAGAGVIIELGCETDFVAKTDDFQALAQRIADAIVKDASVDSPEAAGALGLGEETVEAAVTNAAATMGENIALKRVSRVSSGAVVGSYIHAGGKLGVVVGLDGGDGSDYASVARDLAMHVAAIDPTPVAIDRDGVPADLIEGEKKILRAQAIESGKPENIVDKIVDGRINKFYSENCLLEQPFVKDPDLSVTKMLEGVNKDLSVAAFVRFKLGEAQG
ncbi:MAG: translation elongation factor Ts [Myxococcota bacterium]|jgi:elongation factor Ts|nr:translation elongation factor Ts [Myxococcota bacterium]